MQGDSTATSSPIEALSEANRSLVESLAAAQERNLKYAQSVFESKIALLKSHVESARSLLEQWDQQAQKQPGVQRVTETYAGLFHAPLSAYQQVLEVMETASSQGSAGRRPLHYWVAVPQFASQRSPR